jgi:hypothetical protein
VERREAGHARTLLSRGNKREEDAEVISADQVRGACLYPMRSLSKTSRRGLRVASPCDISALHLRRTLMSAGAYLCKRLFKSTVPRSHSSLYSPPYFILTSSITSQAITRLTFAMWSNAKPSVSHIESTAGIQPLQVSEIQVEIEKIVLLSEKEFRAEEKKLLRKVSHPLPPGPPLRCCVPSPLCSQSDRRASHRSTSLFYPCSSSS